MYEESHASLYIRKCANTSPYMRRPLVIYDLATAPFWISLNMRKLWFSLLSVRGPSLVELYQRIEMTLVKSLHNLTQSVRLFHFLYHHRGLPATAGRVEITWTSAPMWQNAEPTQSTFYINHYSEFAPDAVFSHAWKDSFLLLKWISFHNIDKAGHFFMKTFGQIMDRPFIHKIRFLFKKN